MGAQAFKRLDNYSNSSLYKNSKGEVIPFPGNNVNNTIKQSQNSEVIQFPKNQPLYKNNSGEVIPFPGNNVNNTIKQNQNSKVIQFPKNQPLYKNNSGEIIPFPGNNMNNTIKQNQNSKVIQFPEVPLREDTDILLSDWIKLHPSEEDLKKLFLDIDVAVRFLHDNGYCVEVFHPSQIYILGGKTDHIKFRIVPLPTDYESNDRMIKEDIFNSALVQIGIYTNTLDKLTPEFLRNNFDEISQFLPEADVPYYRGVVQRGAKVYLSDFVAERSKRDLGALEDQLGVKEEDRIDKSNLVPLEHNKILAGIYGLAKRDAAFVNYLIIPTLILISLFIIGLVGWIISLF